MSSMRSPKSAYQERLRRPGSTISRAPNADPIGNTQATENGRFFESGLAMGL